MTDLPKYLRAACDAVRAHSYDDHLEFTLAAVIVTGGQIVSEGFNSSKVTSFIRNFAVNDHSHMHAECDAILRARRRVNMRGAKMFVARLTRVKGIVSNSKPCEMCVNAARLYGIKRIYYTIDERTYAVIRL